MISISFLLCRENPLAEWNWPAFTQVERQGFGGTSVRTARWRYTEGDEGRRGNELYDHDHDPGEMKNLAADAAHAQRRSRNEGLDEEELARANHRRGAGSHVEMTASFVPDSILCPAYYPDSFVSG